MSDLKELIERELESFIEWDGDDKSIVTTTSAKLFAEHVAKIYADHVAGARKMVAAVQGEPVAYMFADDWGRAKIVLGKETAEHLAPTGEAIEPPYTAPQPTDQQSSDSVAVHVDKQCREDVAAALGFIRGGNYTWSYLLQQIKDAVSVAEQQPDITRLIEWDALRAECEKLRNLLCYAQPIIRADAGASHELVEAINAAIRGV